MICDRCLRPARGAHGVGVCPLESRTSAASVKPDTILGGFLAENAWREPQYFDSQRAYEKALDRDGLMLKPPKTRGAQGLMDPQTLANAQALVARMAARTKSVAIDTRTLDEALTVEAE